LPETIDDGLTGLLVDDVHSAVAAVPRVLRMDRGIVAATARRRFSADRMVEEYLAVYERVVEHPQWT
jgi:hypothetical protein